MISVHKLNKRSVDVPLPYDTHIGLSMEDALMILKNPNNVIVAFRDGYSEYTVLFLNYGEIHGMYYLDYRRVIGNPKAIDCAELNLLDVDLLEMIKASRSTQPAHPEGWLKFFTDPEGIELSGLRVYDVSYKARTTTTLHLKD